MTPREMSELTAFDLMAELGDQIAFTAGNARFLINVRNAAATAASMWPEDATEDPHGLAHNIASSTDWTFGSEADGGQDWHWVQAFALLKILLDAYTPEEV